MLYLLLSPLTWVLVTALLLGLAWSRLGRFWRSVGIVLLVLTGLLFTPLGANLLVRNLERQLAPETYCGPTAAGPVVLLSGGVDYRPDSVEDYAALTHKSWRRLRGAVTLWRHSPQSMLWIAGGGPYAIKESELLGQLAQDWRVPRAQLQLETQSTTTWESAFALRGKAPRQIRLVSSAMHLPRARIAFQAAGFEACVVASDSDYQALGGLGYLLPQASALVKSQAALHELVGGWYYRVRRR